MRVCALLLALAAISAPDARPAKPASKDAGRISEEDLDPSNPFGTYKRTDPEESAKEEEPWPAEEEEEAPEKPDAGTRAAAPVEAPATDEPPDAGPAGDGGTPAEEQPTAIDRGALTAPVFDPNWHALGKLEDVERHLESRAKLVRSGDLGTAELELANMLEAKRKLGILDIPVASAALIHEARRALAERDFDRAVSTADAAAKLSPDLPAAHWMRLAAHFRFRPGDVPSLARIVFDAAAAELGRFRNEVGLLADVIAITALALFGAIVLFTVIQYIKYLRYAAHDLARPTRGFVSDFQAGLFLLLALLAPLLLGYGAAVVLLIAITVVIAYQFRRERMVSFFSIIAIAALPGAIYLAAPLVTFHGSVPDVIEEATTEAFATQAESKLERIAAEPGAVGTEAALVLGQRARIRGDLADAEKWYRIATNASDEVSAVAAKNNLGVVLFLLRKPEAALAAFRDAAQRRLRPQPWLNVATLLADQGLFDEAVAAVSEARKIDRGITRAYNDLEAKVPTPEKLLEVPFSAQLLWGRVFDVDGERRMDVTRHLWRYFGGRTPFVVVPILAVMCLVMGLFLTSERVNLRLCTPCPRCGEPASTEAPDHYCDQCNVIYLKALAVDPSLRLSKERRIRVWEWSRRWIERALAVVAGAGHVFGGRPIAGTVLLFMFLGALIYIGWIQWAQVDPWAVWSGVPGLQIGAALLFAGTLSLVSLWRVFRR